MTSEKVTWEDVLKAIPEHVELYHVDYRDNLGYCTEEIEQCIHRGNLDALYDLVYDWDDDRQQYFDDLRDEFGEDVVYEYEDQILDVLFARDKSTPIQDLIRNTGRLIAHYNTGYYMEGESWSWKCSRVAEERESIKKHLGVTTNALDTDIDETIRWASYGGELLIYFEVDIDEVIKEGKEIVFTDYHVGVVDHWNGSGDVMHMENQVCKLPFVRENVSLELNVRYNWTYEIAGMVRDWCESTQVKIK